LRCSFGDIGSTTNRIEEQRISLNFAQRLLRSHDKQILRFVLKTGIVRYLIYDVSCFSVKKYLVRRLRKNTLWVALHSD